MILLLQFSFYVVEPKNFPFIIFRARDGARAKIKKKVEMEPKLNNIGSATLQSDVMSRKVSAFNLVGKLYQF